MTRIVITLLAAAIAMTISAQAADPPFAPGAGSLIRTATAGASGSFMLSQQVEVENRARVLGNKADASATRYWEVSYQDIQGKTPAQVLNRLTPPAVSSGGQPVRTMDIVVDFVRPVLIQASSTKPVQIGTVSVNAAAARDLTVNTLITASGITIVPLRK